MSRVEYIKADSFIEIALSCEFDIAAMTDELRKQNPHIRRKEVARRLRRYRAKGILPLDSGNLVSTGEVLKGTSTMYDGEGNIVLQWVKSDIDREQQLDAVLTAIQDCALESIPSIPIIKRTSVDILANMATLYISNDIHFGALMDGNESGKDWDTAIAADKVKAAFDYLAETVPASKIGIIADLGDTLEVNDSRNMTPKSGNVLAVDSRFYKILRTAYETFIYAIYKALEKHEIVYFYNIGGNHDEIPSIAIREVIRMVFRNNPRVIVDDSPSNIKYHQHGAVLLQFAHGHAMKMRNAGETMAHDMQHIFSETRYRFSHMGHIHKDAVYDSPICRTESHRNLAPLNHYAHEHGYRTNGNTMKAITYDATRGEISRQIYNIM